MVLAVLLQNSCVFQAFSDRSTSGQPWAWPPIDGKSFKKLEKLGKHSYFDHFCQKKQEKLRKTLVLAVLLQNSWVFPAFGDRRTSGQSGARLQ